MYFDVWLCYIDAKAKKGVGVADSLAWPTRLSPTLTCLSGIICGGSNTSLVPKSETDFSKVVGTFLLAPSSGLGSQHLPCTQENEGVSRGFSHRSASAEGPGETDIRF